MPAGRNAKSSVSFSFQKSGDQAPELILRRFQGSRFQGSSGSFLNPFPPPRKASSMGYGEYGVCELGDREAVSPLNKHELTFALKSQPPPPLLQALKVLISRNMAQRHALP